jgi:hypothetical protein
VTDLRDFDARHEWWAVELRRLSESSAAAAAAFEALVEVMSEGPDCAECFDQWAENYGPDREIEDFPEALAEEHVIRILALEDAVLVRHALEQWLMALGARRRKRIEEELAKARERGVLAATLVAVPGERPSARMRARSDQQG